MYVKGVSKQSIGLGKQVLLQLPLPSAWQLYNLPSLAREDALEPCQPHTVPPSRTLAVDCTLHT